MSERKKLGTPKMWFNNITGSELRVMAMTEGYAMVRLKGCVPFVIWKKDLEANYTPQRETK